MPRARTRKTCGVWARSRGRFCVAPVAVGTRCWWHWGSGGTRNAQPPWTLTTAAGDLAAHPERVPRRLQRESASRYVSPWAAKELIRRGIITRAVFLASSTKPDRFLRRLERDGIGVEPESAGELVRAYRFVLPEAEP